MGFLKWLFSRKALGPTSAQEQQLDDSGFSEQEEAALQQLRALQQFSADDTGREEDFTDSTTIPVGKWLRIKQLQICSSFVGYTYVDQQAGLSARGSSQRDPKLTVAPCISVRLPMPGAMWRGLDQEERDRWHLPERPEWLDSCGPQPEPGSLWHGKFLS